MQGWVVHQAAFVQGLAAWYERYKLPAGALVKLERTRDPRVVTVDYEPSRLRGVWVRFAAMREGELTFQVRKVSLACDYDEHLLMGEDNREALERYAARSLRQGESLADLLAKIVPSLAGLNPLGTVHAKTIYAAVNVVRRTPPGPVFALLSTEPGFVAKGRGYWAYDAELAE
jgi:hypothetical protein